jgi:hypothetical protein
MAVALAGIIAWVALAAPAAPAADGKLGLLAHYELCEGSDWMSLDDIAVNSASGDIWLEAGLSHPRLVHAATTGVVLGTNTGEGIPGGATAGFGDDFDVSFAPGGVFVADANGDYPASPGRILKFSTGRTPAFISHFVRPPGTMPADQTLIAAPVDILAAALGGETDVLAIDNSELIIYDENGKFVDSLVPVAGSDVAQPPHGWGSGLGAAGMAAAGFALYVSDPTNHKIKLYALGGPNPPFSNRYTLKHYTDYPITVGRLAGNRGGKLYGLTSSGVARINSFQLGGTGIGGEILDELPIEGAKGLTVSADGEVWVTRNDGILRLGPNGGPVPPPQNVDVNARCGAPRISRSFPTSQDIDRTGYLALDAGCSEPCVLGMTATLVTGVRAAAKFTVQPVTHNLSRPGKARFKLRFTRAAVRAIHSAHARGTKSSVAIQMTARDRGRTVRRQSLALILG